MISIDSAWWSVWVNGHLALFKTILLYLRIGVFGYTQSATYPDQMDPYVAQPTHNLCTMRSPSTHDTKSLNSEQQSNKMTFRFRTDVQNVLIFLIYSYKTVRTCKYKRYILICLYHFPRDVSLRKGWVFPGSDAAQALEYKQTKANRSDMWLPIRNSQRFGQYVRSTLKPTSIVPD